jgi:hypothetical protein
MKKQAVQLSQLSQPALSCQYFSKHSPTLVECGGLLLLIVARASVKGKIFPLVTEKILARVVDFAARLGCFCV